MVGKKEGGMIGSMNNTASSNGGGGGGGGGGENTMPDISTTTAVKDDDNNKNIDDKETTFAKKTKKNNRRRIGKKLDWSHVKSRTDCHLQRKDYPKRRNRNDTNFTGAKTSFPSDLPWNIIDNDTGRSAYEQDHYNGTPLRINTKLSNLLSPKNKDNNHRRKKNINNRPGKTQYTEPLDYFEEDHSVETPFERYQRGPVSPKYDQHVDPNTFIDDVDDPRNTLKLEELGQLLQQLSESDRRLLEQDEEADMNTTIPRLDRRAFFKVYDDHKYEAETNRLKQEYIDLGGAEVSPTSPF